MCYDPSIEIRIRFEIWYRCKQKNLPPIFSNEGQDKIFLSKFGASKLVCYICPKHKYNMSVNIIEIKDGRKLHDRLLKKESVSPLEVIRNEYNRFSYNVVRRPEGKCLGNLRYFNLNYDRKTGHFFKKSSI